MPRTRTSPASSRRATILSIQRISTFSLHLISVTIPMIRMFGKIRSPVNVLLPLRSRSCWTLHNILSSKRKQHFEDGNTSKRAHIELIDATEGGLGSSNTGYPARWTYDEFVLSYYMLVHSSLRTSDIRDTANKILTSVLGPAGAKAWISINLGWQRSSSVLTCWHSRFRFRLGRRWTTSLIPVHPVGDSKLLARREVCHES